MKSHFGERRVDGTPSERRPPAGSLPEVEPTNYSDSGSMGGAPILGEYITTHNGGFIYACLCVQSCHVRCTSARHPIKYSEYNNE